MFNFFNIFSRTKWQSDIVPFPTELHNIEMMKIMHIRSETSADFTKQDIARFLTFMKRGSCTKILKGSTRYHIEIFHDKGVSNYYINSDRLAPEPGGLVQETFEPKERGFEVFLHSFFQP